MDKTLMRAIAVAAVTLFATSCGGASNVQVDEVVESANKAEGVDSPGTTEASSTTQTPTTTTVPFPHDVNVHPLLLEIDHNAARIYGYEELVDSDEYADAAECANVQAARVLEPERAVELVDGSTFAIDKLKAAERKELAQAISQCDWAEEHLTTLLRMAEPHLAGCTAARIIDLGRIDEVLQTSFESIATETSSLATSFGNSCASQTFDELYGAHPPGTLGEDRRLVVEAIVDGAWGAQGTIAWCSTCFMMSRTTDDWVQGFLASDYGHPADYLNDRVGSYAPDRFDEAPPELAEDAAVMSSLYETPRECYPAIDTLELVLDVQVTEEERSCLWGIEPQAALFDYFSGSEPWTTEIANQQVDALLDNCGAQ